MRGDDYGRPANQLTARKVLKLLTPQVGLGHQKYDSFLPENRKLWEPEKISLQISSTGYSLRLAILIFRLFAPSSSPEPATADFRGFA